MSLLGGRSDADVTLQLLVVGLFLLGNVLHEASPEKKKQHKNKTESVNNNKKQFVNIQRF